MTLQILYSLIAASFGFVAGVYFCVASAFLRQKTIVVLSTTFYGYNRQAALAKVSQSTQYVIGGLLLLVSFLFQIAAILTTSTNPIEIFLNFESSLALILSIVILFVILILGLSYGFYKLLYQWRSKKVLEELKKVLSS